MASPVSFKNAILPLFSQDDINHMAPMGVKLDDYAWMSDSAGGTVGSAGPFPDHANGRACYAYLTGDATPRMPLGGPYFDQQKLDLYASWMADGFAP